MTMQAEQLEIAGFIANYAPFDSLEEAAINELSKQVEVAYYRAGSDILHYAEAIHDLYIVRSGAVETYRRNGELYNRLDMGGIFGQMGLLMNRRVRFPVKAIEDTLVYCIPADLFFDYCDRYETFADFFESDDSASLRRAVSEQSDNNDLTTVKVKSLLVRDVITVSGETSILQAAKIMTDEHVSSLLVVEPQNKTDPEDDSQGETDGLAGIITDRDLRIRVLATGLDLQTPVAEIMSTDLITLDDEAYVFEAMLTMLRHNVHHLPILRHNTIVGVLVLSDIVRHESQSSILFVRSIFIQPDVEALVHLSQQLPGVFVRMVKEDANSQMIGSAMAVIGRSFKQRLLELAEEKLGPPPIPYCFMALGSMARDEQLIYTDQDNALILHNSYDPKLHGDYFEALANFVCDGLAACGYTYCEGGIMASNAQWRLPLEAWKAQFSQWIEEANPQALLNSSIFFDLDAVWGETKWTKELLRLITDRTKKHPRFLISLARNALNRTPPLGFFKSFVLEQDGQHKKTINLKRRGTAPLTDVIRVHALAIGSRSINSFSRLDDIEASNILPEGKVSDLRDALEYLSMIRIKNQANQIEQEQPVSNNVQPDELTSFERRNLKEAFQVINTAQSFLKFRYHAKSPLK